MADVEITVVIPEAWVSDTIEAFTKVAGSRIDMQAHKFTLSYGGDTFVMENITVDHPIVWALEFPPVTELLGDVIARLKRISH